MAKKKIDYSDPEEVRKYASSLIENRITEEGKACAAMGLILMEEYFALKAMGECTPDKLQKIISSMRGCLSDSRAFDKDASDEIIAQLERKAQAQEQTQAKVGNLQRRSG